MVSNSVDKLPRKQKYKQPKNQDRQNASRAIFRLDIKGLRAISVLLVMFFHAGFEIFSGGFVGVDVFFVISGYVISGLLLNEYQETGKVDFLNFYCKRVLRLVPALALLICVSLFLAIIIFPPAEQLRQYDAAKFSLVWFGNIYFQTFNFDYFSPSIQENLFLHTWSLGVEEQFYLIWPALMLWMLSPLNDITKDNFFYKVCGVAFASLVIQILLSDNAAFYSMPSRIWQFTLGGGIAYLHYKPFIGRKVLSPFANNVGSVIGGALVICTAIIFNEHEPYPGWRAMLPSVGAAMILFFYSSQKMSIVSQCLSLKPLVFLGNLSYSLYLWHWVVLVFFSQLYLFFPGLNPVVGLIITLPLAGLSYYFIEMPIRKNKALASRPLLTLAVTFALLAAMWLMISVMEKRSESQNDSALSEIANIRFDIPELYKTNCDDWYHSSELNVCHFGKSGGKKSLVLFGDSVVAQWFPLIEELYPESAWEIIVLTKSACPVVDVPYYYSRIKSEYKVCEVWREKAVSYIQNIRPDVVVMGSSGAYPYSETDWKKGTASILDQLAPVTAEIKLFASTPQLSFDLLDCLSRAFWLHNALQFIDGEICREPIKTFDSWLYLFEVSEKYNNVRFLNFSEFICPDGVCSAKVNGLITYRDSTHLTASFVKSLFDKVKDHFN